MKKKIENLIPGVCIVECIDEGDPGSEGRLLREVLRMMHIDSKLIRANCVSELFDAIENTNMMHVHVSTHGAINSSKAFRGWWTEHDVGTKKLLGSLDPKTKCHSILSTACKSGSQGFARFIIDSVGAQHYIAPTGSPHWHNAALFMHIYYHKLFKTEGTVTKAFRAYERKYKNPHGFTLFSRPL